MCKRILLIISILMLAGCWDRQEINDVAFVSGSAIDMKDDQYKLTIQIPLPGQMGGAGSKGGGGGTSGGKSWYNESEVADNLSKAGALQQDRASRELYFAHRRTIIFGEKFAANGLEEFLDVFIRVPQNRLTSFVVIAKGNAADVLSADVPIEKNPSEMVRELANFSIKNPKTIKNLVHSVLSEGSDPALLTISVKDLPPEAGPSKQTIQIDGLAVFKGDKLAGFLNGDSATGVLWAMNESHNPKIFVSPPKGEGEITLIFPESETELKPIFEGETITIQMKVKAKGSIVDNESNYDNTTKDHLLKLEKVAEEEIKNQIEKGLNKLQQEFQSDPIGFGHLIYLKNPTKWYEIKDRWHEIYPTVHVDVQTFVHIEHAGSLTSPLGVKEKKQIND